MLLGAGVLVAAGGWNWFQGFLSSSAPAWVQAIGSIGVIWQAYRIGHKNDRAIARGAKNQATIFKAAVRDAMAEMLMSAQLRDAWGYRNGLADLSVAIDLGRAVRLDLLKDLDVVSISRFRSIAARAARCESTIDSAFDYGFYANMLDLLMKECERAEMR
jgi:hypothetical protein